VPSLRPDEIDREHVLSAKVLLVDGHDIQAAIEAAGWANEAHIPVVYDAGTARENTDVLFERTNYLAASRVFASAFTGEDDPEKAARAMLGGRRKLSAVTLGDEGCVYATSEGTAYQPAFKVDTVDTTGAGDVFHGALSFGVLKGWPIPEMVEFASAVAAMKCTALGGRTAIPSLPQALEFLRERSLNGFWISL
jgi:sulfofructose kinase